MYSQNESSLLRHRNIILLFSVRRRPKDYINALRCDIVNKMGVLLIYFIYRYMCLLISHSIERRMIVRLMKNELEKM
jgi:hypothetical protein